MDPNIKLALSKAEKFKVLIIGDTIIDEYVFVNPKGRATKDPILSVDYVSKERYAGGALAIANHLSEFVKEINLITILGKKKPDETFVKSHLNSNINPKFIYKNAGVTTIKRRYIDEIRNEKLFKVEYITDNPLIPEEIEQVLQMIKQKAPMADIIFVADFGHGFINKPIIQEIEKYSEKLCLNVQSNSANLGFNYITKYNSASFLSLDQKELQLCLQERFEDNEKLIKQLCEIRDFNSVLLTLGKKGNKIFKSGVFYDDCARAEKVKDAVGAGDAVFAIAGLLNHTGLNPKSIAYAGNCAGAIAANIMGNKENIKKQELIEFMERHPI